MIRIRFAWPGGGRMPTMHMLHRQWQHQQSKSSLLRYLTVPVLLWFILACIFLSSRYSNPISAAPYNPPPRMTIESKIFQPLEPRMSCVGPRGALLSESPDDDLKYESTPSEYPVPFMGSYTSMKIGRSWLTADGRYGPYGYGEESAAYSRSKVDWDAVDWAKIQDDCFAKNAQRFPNPKVPSVNIKDDGRFALLKDSKIDPAPSWIGRHNNTRRTALVMRAYEGFEYTPQVLWHIRSVIVEAALHTGGEYAVFLLVNVQRKGPNIFESEEAYAAAFDRAGIPPELHSISVLWDERLLQSWYPLIREHSPKWQIYQPLQLFALHHPEFDHYWELEMDQRFMGDAGKYLDAMADFARQEPRKQALERATYAFSEAAYGSYDEYKRRTDEANNGGSQAWGPIPIPDVHPIGPVPPTPRPEDDPFEWGVGEEADLVVTSFCRDVLTAKSWFFRKWVVGLTGGRRTPRWFCPPAVVRSSRALLLAAHEAHHLRGQTIASESMLPSWALWLGLKLSYPPQPVHADSATTPTGANGRQPARGWWGGAATTPKSPWFGLRPDDVREPDDFDGAGLSWWWRSSSPNKIMNAWLAANASAPNMPGLLVVQDGKVLAPNIALHPVKT